MNSKKEKRKVLKIHSYRNGFNTYLHCNYAENLCY